MSILNGVTAPTIKVEFDLSLPLGPKNFPSWTEVSNTLVRSVSIRRGKTQENQVVQPGEATIVLDNRSGDFDPMNDASPYWKSTLLGGYSYLSTNLGVRVSATWNSTTYPLFVGYLEQLNLDYGLNPSVSITFTDALAWIAKQQIAPEPTPAGNGDPVYYRCATYLSLISFPALLQNLSPSVSNTLYGTKYGADALSLLQTAADCGPARLFVDASGVVQLMTWDGGTDQLLVLSDAGTAGTVGYNNLEVDPGSKYLLNYVTINKYDGTGTYVGTVVGVDVDSEGRFGPVGAVYDLPVNTATALANFLATQYSEPFDRIRQVTFSMTNLGTAFPKVLSTEIADTISLVRTTYDGRSLDFACNVEGISHDITPESWSVSYLCSTQSATSEGGDNWFAELGYDTGSDFFNHGVVDSADNMYGVGASGDGYLMARASATGVLQWQRFLDVGQGSISSFLGVRKDSGTNLYMGAVHPSICTVVKTDSDGVPQGGLGVTATAGYGLNDFAVDAAGAVYLAGDVGNRMNIIKATATGGVVWQRFIDSPSRALAVTVDSAGAVYIGGTINTGTATPLLLKLNSGGVLVWAKVPSTTGALTNSRLRVDGSGNIWWQLNDYRTIIVSSGGSIVDQFDANGASLLNVDSSGGYFFGGSLIRTNVYGAIAFVREVSGSSSAVVDAYSNSNGDMCLFGYANAGSYANALMGRVPGDGSKTDTYTITGIADSTFTYGAASFTFGSSSLTFSDPTVTVDDVTTATVSSLSTTSAITSHLWATEYF